MPYSITLDKAPAGYVLENATEGGLVKIAVTEFTSSEDGELFISRLEGFPSDIIARLPPSADVRPSSVEHMLAIIHPDLKTDVYVNDCQVRVLARASRSIQAGEAVGEDDIVDIDVLEFVGVEVPPEAAVVCILSAGWRKGLFFDVVPLGPGQLVREYDLRRTLGSFYAYLLNQRVFKLDESQWELLFKQGWFPFVSLPKRILRQMISAVRCGSSIEQNTQSVAEAIRAMAPLMRTRWGEPSLFQEHLPLLQHGMDRFLEGDYVSATSILYPRIEGILRSIHGSSGAASGFKQSRLAQAAVHAWVDRVHEYSWLLPRRFKEYLERVYFASFSPGQQASLSRHSVGHGVAQSCDFDQKHACIAIFIVDQLRFLLPPNLTTVVADGVRHEA